MARFVRATCRGRCEYQVARTRRPLKTEWTKVTLIAMYNGGHYRCHKPVGEMSI